MSLNHPTVSIGPVVPVDTRRDTWAFLLIVFVTLGGFAAWGVFAQLDAGAIANGEVIPAGRIRTIQHAEGGIVRTFMVQDGDRVRQGDVLLTLDDREFRAAAAIAERELAGLLARLAGVRREVASWSARQASLELLAKNTDEEQQLNRELYEQKFISRPRLLQLENQSAQTQATIGENSAELARARQRLAELEALAATTRERREVALERLERTRITAPQDGIVNNLKYVTLGGVIPPGGAILDIVPINEQLVVEAKVSPDDIDVVVPGLICRVKLTAYKARSHLTLQGRVTKVSGSTYRDETMHIGYYRVQIEIDGDELRKVEQGLLLPGMQAQVDIVSGKRSAMRYLFDPILDSIGRAFKES